MHELVANLYSLSNLVEKRKTNRIEPTYILLHTGGGFEGISALQGVRWQGEEAHLQDGR